MIIIMIIIIIIELVQELGSLVAHITGDSRETTYLLKQLSVGGFAKQTDAVSFQNTFTAG